MVASNYGAGIYLSDFIGKPEDARKDINYWVYNETQGRINDFSPEGTIQVDTRMLLVNTVYFNSTWGSQFDLSDTTDAPFHLLSSKDVVVKMMNQIMYVPYYLSAGVQAVELPYSGGATIILIVPDQGNFDTFESSFNAKKIDEIFNHLEPFPLQISLPRFAFESEFALPETLESMGITHAFTAYKADFSGITTNKVFFIGNLLHKTSINVDEEGTEATATTGIIIIEVAGRRPADVSLTIDRPFIFVIRDPNHQTLFIGRVLDPSR